MKKHSGKSCLLVTGLLVTVLIIHGCSGVEHVPNTKEVSKKLQIVATSFSQYDFARQIAREKAELTLIVTPGMDSHAFEPKPSDMIAIQGADIFLYNGGEMEYWVDEVLESMEREEKVTLRMMDTVDTFETELVEGMESNHEEDEHYHEIEYDEHIWTSPVNAMEMVKAITKGICTADPANQEYYLNNARAYLEDLKELDNQFRQVVEEGSRNLLVFGDKFPFRYFIEEYGLTYRAAFTGCSTDTEPSIDTLIYLIDKVREEKIPVVYYGELSSPKIARTISEETGAKMLLLHSCHTVSKEDFNRGITYLELMKQNVKNLKEGLQ